MKKVYYLKLIVCIVLLCFVSAQYEVVGQHRLLAPKSLTESISAQSEKGKGSGTFFDFIKRFKFTFIYLVLVSSLTVSFFVSPLSFFYNDSWSSRFGAEKSYTPSNSYDLDDYIYDFFAIKSKNKSPKKRAKIAIIKSPKKNAWTGNFIKESFDVINEDGSLATSNKLKAETFEQIKLPSDLTQKLKKGEKDLLKDIEDITNKENALFKDIEKEQRALLKALNGDGATITLPNNGKTELSVESILVRLSAINIAQMLNPNTLTESIIFKTAEPNTVKEGKRIVLMRRLMSLIDWIKVTDTDGNTVSFKRVGQAEIEIEEDATVHIEWKVDVYNLIKWETTQTNRLSQKEREDFERIFGPTIKGQTGKTLEELRNTPEKNRYETIKEFMKKTFSYDINAPYKYNGISWSDTIGNLPKDPQNNLIGLICNGTADIFMIACLCLNLDVIYHTVETAPEDDGIFYQDSYPHALCSVKINGVWQEAETTSFVSTKAVSGDPTLSQLESSQIIYSRSFMWIVAILLSLILQMIYVIKNLLKRNEENNTAEIKEKTTPLGPNIVIAPAIAYSI